MDLPTPDRPPETWATYRLDNGQHRTYHLGQPASFRMGNLSLVEAYPLTADYGPFTYLVSPLDTDFIAFRQDGHCTDRVQECRESTIIMGAEGGLPPVPIGLDRLFREDGRHVFFVGGVPVEIRAEVVREAARLTLTFHELGPLALQLPQEVVYDGGSWFPSRVVSEGLTLSLVSLREGEALGPVEARHARTVGYGRASVHRFFNGEGDDPFSIGMTHLAILEAFLSEVPEAANVLSGGGCLARYTVYPYRWETELAFLGGERLADVEVTVAEKDGSAKTWSFSIRRDMLGTPTIMEMRNETADSVPECTSATSGTGPWADAQGFSDAATAIVSRTTTPAGFSYFFESSTALGPYPEAHGWHHYAMYFVPEHIGSGGGAWSPYTVHLNAVCDEIQTLVVHPDDAARFDAGVG